MKQPYKKTLWASVIAFFVGTSCCWLSSLAIWLGGATIIGLISSFIENIQWPLIALSVLLGLISLVLYLKKTKNG